MTGKCLLNDASETQKGTPRGICQAEWEGLRMAMRMPVAMRCHEEYAAGVAIDAIDPIVDAAAAAVVVANVADDAQLSP